MKREEAIELITPVVDGEAPADQSRAFFQYCRQDEEIRRHFEQQKRIKYLIRHRLPRFNAPRHLRLQVEEMIFRTTDLPEN